MAVLLGVSISDYNDVCCSGSSYGSPDLNQWVSGSSRSMPLSQFKTFCVNITLTHCVGNSIVCVKDFKNDSNYIVIPSL